MSQLFGPIRQLGIMVTSLDRALEYYTKTLRIGPFFRMDHVETEYFRYRGQPCDADVSLALAYSGDMQIELVEQHNDAPSLYSDFLERNGPGLQHYAVWAEDYDDKMSRLSENGVTLLAEAKLQNGGRFAYFDCGDAAEPVIEIVELTPLAAGLFQMIREAADTWDGSDPVR